jgi:hypothetical protein
MRTLDISSDFLTAVVERILANGGATVDLQTEDLEPATPRYIRSIAGHEVIVDADLLPSGMLRAVLTYVLVGYIRDHGSALLEQGAYLGAWVDGSQVYLDVSTGSDDLVTTLTAAADAGQLAIWDSVDFVSIPTPWES